MDSNLLERLAEMEVPPPPAQFDAQLHERVNRGLVIEQFLDLITRALPWALAHFGRALFGLVVYTLLGRYETGKKDDRRRAS